MAIGDAGRAAGMVKLSLLAFSLLFAVPASAISRKEYPSARPAALTPVYQNDGDTVAPFVVTPTTHTWTLVASSSSVRRRLDIEIINNATSALGAGVCLSTTSSAGNTCSNSRGGYELLMSTPQARVTLFGEAAWYARIRGGDENRAALRGAVYYDSGD